MNYNNVSFLKSAAEEKNLINSSMPCVAFAGKSNVGKSSVINRILNRKNFARVGSEPGKTVHVNYFNVDGKCLFADLPGYGFAKVPQKEKERWSKLMEAFFKGDYYTLGVMIVDARHAPTADDVQMAAYFLGSGRKFIVVANKADKVKKSELDNNLKCIAEKLTLTESGQLIAFSAETGFGKEQLISFIENNI